MERTIEKKTSVEKVKETAFLMGGLLTYRMPAKWIRLVRWLQVATSKDPRLPVKHAFHVEGTRIETTDGFRIHQVEFATPEARLLPEGLLELVSISKRNVTFIDAMYPGAFPNTQLIEYMKPLKTVVTPDNEGRYPGVELENVTAFVHVSPDLMSSTLKLPDTRGTKITIHDGPMLIEFNTRKSGYEDIGVRAVQAILMPAATGRGYFSGLTPHQAAG